MHLVVGSYFESNHKSIGKFLLAQGQTEQKYHLKHVLVNEFGYLTFFTGTVHKYLTLTEPGGRQKSRAWRGVNSNASPDLQGKRKLGSCVSAVVQDCNHTVQTFFCCQKRREKPGQLPKMQKSTFLFPVDRGKVFILKSIKY